MSTLDMDDLRQWIGREEEQSERVTSSLVDRFNATFDRADPAGDGDAAPRLIHFCLAPPAANTSALGPDGHPARGGFLPPVPLPRRMWAGGAIVFIGDIRVGETVIRRSKIRDIVVKQGRSGTLCFVTVDHAVECGGQSVIEERQDIVYRDAPAPGGVPKTPEPAPRGAHCSVVTPSPTLLFRYSALTFNGHRIHYDVPYARDVEDYPGLVVHGPMQATMLLRFAEGIARRRPARFEFRSLSPLYDNRDFTLNATGDEDGMKLWTATAGGPVAMEARVRW